MTNKQEFFSDVIAFLMAAFVVVIMGVLFPGCCPNPEANTTSHTDVIQDTCQTNLKFKAYYNSPNGCTYQLTSQTVRPIQFGYNGHDYIMFVFSGGDKCVVHDPDCHCHTEIVTTPVEIAKDITDKEFTFEEYE